MAAVNSISIRDSSGREIPNGQFAPAGNVSFSGTTKPNEKVHVEVGGNKFSFLSPVEQLSTNTISLTSGVYTANYHFEHLGVTQSRVFKLR